MKKRFAEGKDKADPDMVHDYIVYSAHESTLMQRYYNNIEKVSKAMSHLIKGMNIHGQWSIDVMQNGDDFYVIDMALAINSALRDVVPKELLMPIDDKQLYLPDFSKQNKGLYQ